MNPNLEFKMRYENAKLHAKVKSLEYENRMFNQLIRKFMDSSKSSDGTNPDIPRYQSSSPAMATSSSERFKSHIAPSQKDESKIIFTKTDFEDEDEEEYDEEEGEYDEVYDEEGYYDGDGNYIPYDEKFEQEEEEEKLGRNVLDNSNLLEQNVGDNPNLLEQNVAEDEMICQIYEQAVEGKSEYSSEEDEEQLNFKPVKKSSKKDKEEKVLLEFDFQKQKDSMTLLYGEENAAKVYSCEARMQMEFNQICDELRPQIWPCLPLNLKFD